MGILWLRFVHHRGVMDSANSCIAYALFAAAMPVEGNALFHGQACVISLNYPLFVWQKKLIEMVNSALMPAIANCAPKSQAIHF